jgi:hypothetical protein
MYELTRHWLYVGGHPESSFPSIKHLLSDLSSLDIEAIYILCVYPTLLVSPSHIEFLSADHVTRKCRYAWWLNLCEFIVKE